MKYNKLIISAFLCFAVSSVFAQSIRIVSPEIYDGEYTKYAYETNINDVIVSFTGKVSKNCKSVRVIWSDQSSNAIDTYVYNGFPKTDRIYRTESDVYLKKFTPGTDVFNYNASGKYENLSFGSNYYRFIAYFTNGTVAVTDVSLYVHSGGAAEKGKPVIYLYPTKKTNVKVNVKPKGAFTTTIPEIGKGWNVTANPDGKIYDKVSKKEYPYLFWESVDSAEPIDLKEGFVVAKDELVGFMEDKLSYQGLNDKEIGDFLEFWEEKLTKAPYVFITFYSPEKINENAPLTISPKPDSIIRVYFDYKLLDGPIQTKEQALIKGERKGFTVVEWGGRLYK